jgi:transposase
LPAQDWRQVHEGLEVRLCPAPDGAEVFILCRSAERQQKEQAIHARFEKRIEDGLRKIETTCQKHKQNPLLIAQRVGRLLGHNTRAAGLFQIQVESDRQGAARVRWTRSAAWRDWARRSEGCYLLRSNVTDWTPEELWRAYMQLTQAEDAFHIHKSDLQIRPVWHQKAERVEAHILVCFLAYVLWKTLEAQCRQAGLGDEPRKVFAELSEIALVDVLLPTRNGVTLRKRCISQLNQHQLILLQRLGMRLPTVPEFAPM